MPLLCIMIPLSVFFSDLNVPFLDILLIHPSGSLLGKKTHTKEKMQAKSNRLNFP